MATTISGLNTTQLSDSLATLAGIGHYGNSIGVPTVGGEVYFEAPYEANCLINAMCVGLATQERLIRSAAAGPGNVLVLLGASTGRDGIGGASVLASAELGEGDQAKRFLRCRSATHSPSSSCSSAAWTCSSATCSWPCRTWARRA